MGDANKLRRTLEGALNDLRTPKEKYLAIGNRKKRRRLISIARKHRKAVEKRQVEAAMKDSESLDTAQ